MHIDPNTGKEVWDYTQQGNSQKRMVDLVERGLLGLINCFEFEYDKRVERKKGRRKVLVTVRTYQGIPVRRVERA